jgi:K(+)-stimulated pyrophosphate-energized sodium pump
MLPISPEFQAYLPSAIGVLGLFLALFFYIRVKGLPDGNETMNRIAGYIREGSMAFLAREYKVLAGYSVVVFAILAYSLGMYAACSFLFGAFLSLLAGFFGMKAATYANVRTTQAAISGVRADALLVALDGGAVMGFSVAGLGLIGMGVIYVLFKDSDNFGTVIHSFAVGASSIALFARIGGGIYTKAADVGSDIAGKVIENIPEDDPRNPGVVADNVGDNVGDVAGMGADIYESMVAAVVASMAIALTGTPETMPNLLTGAGDNRFTGVMLPLFLTAIGMLVSIVGIFITRSLRKMNPSMVLRSALIFPPLILVAVSAVLMPMMGITQNVTIALSVGAIGGGVIGLLTDYYTSMGPVAKIAQSSKTGAGTTLIRGLAVGLESVALPSLVVFTESLCRRSECSQELRS